MGDLCGRPLVISSSSPCPSMTILTLLSLMKLPYQVLADPHLPHPPTKQRSDTLGKVATASTHSAPTIFFSAHATSRAWATRSTILSLGQAHISRRTGVPGLASGQWWSFWKARGWAVERRQRGRGAGWTRIGTERRPWVRRVRRTGQARPRMCCVLFLGPL